MSFIVRTCLLALLSLGVVSVGHTQENELELENGIVGENEPILPPENKNEIVQGSDTLDDLFDTLRSDPNENSAKATAGLIWREWSSSGSKTVDLLMSWAARAMGHQQYAAANDFLDQVVVLAPDYAEGWNRRATLYYTMSDYANSISDIRVTLALEPRHFGALSGLAVMLQRMGQDKAALETWYKVLEIYPANRQAQSSVIDLEEKLSGSPT